MSVQNLTDSDFISTIESGKSIVKYYADWCGSCRLVSPKFKKLAANENYAGIKFLEVNAEENENARKLGGVSNLPYFAIFDKGTRIDAAATSKEEALLEMLTKLQQA